MGEPALTRINSLPPEAAEAEFMSCCASLAWARAMVARRPYTHVVAMTGAAREALAELSWPQVAQALAAHPRIGAPPAGERRDAAWSRTEQAGVDHRDDGTLAALTEVNRAYEERFGHVLLIFASGKSGPEMLELARARLGNDTTAEHQVIREELAKIVDLRVRKLAGEEAAVR